MQKGVSGWRIERSVIPSYLTAVGAGEGVMNHRVMLSEATSS